jgi:tetratricopeptide (TPR) repeat protein
MTSIRSLRIMIFFTLFLMVGLAYADSMAFFHYNRGVDFAAQGKFFEAQDSFDQAIRIDPQNRLVLNCQVVLKDVQKKRIKEQTAVHLFRAFSSFNRFKTDEAIRDLNKAAELNPNYALTYSHRGKAKEDKGELNEALSDYHQALEIDPTYAAAYLNRGILYAKQSQFNRAIADYNRALKLEPRNVLAYYNRGNAFGEQGHYDQAIADYDRLLDINPLYPHAYVRKGISCEKAGRPQDALAVYKAYLQKVNLKEQDPRQIQFVQDKIKLLDKQPEGVVQ